MQMVRAWEAAFKAAGHGLTCVRRKARTRGTGRVETAEVWVLEKIQSEGTWKHRRLQLESRRSGVSEMPKAEKISKTGARRSWRTRSYQQR